MVRRATGVVGALVWLAAVAAASAQPAPATPRALRDQYIVVLDDERVAAAQVGAVADALARAQGGRLLRLYRHALRGFSVALPAAAAAALARDPRVRFVEQDAVMTVVDTQVNATWGLDRIDQRSLPLDGSYTYNTVAANVHVYVIDTGVRPSHFDFGGRVSTAGFTSINDGNGTNDCNGHGTHVAGTIGGATWGVAKGVTLHSVRVLNCGGSGTTSGVIAGVDWVTANRALPAVANMSLGGGASSALDSAVRNSVAAGVTYAIAAGNSNANACNYSPARVAEALTVGSTTSADARSSFSNFGTCLDLFAPGSSITSAWHTSDNASNTISGTSMASPHVAGVAALYLADNPLASPGAVHAAVVNNASANKVSGAGSGSPNRLLHAIFGGPGVDSPPTASFTFTCTGLTCTFDGSGSADDRGIASYAWDFGDGSGGAGAMATHSYASGGTFTVSLTVTDTGGQTAVDAKSVTVADSGGAPCTACTKYTGALSGPNDFDYHPNGSYYSSPVSGTHRGWLRGPSNADFDLYLLKWVGFWWVTVARAEGPTSVEEITYTGTPGLYTWAVISYSGSGSYDLWIQRP